MWRFGDCTLIGSPSQADNADRMTEQVEAST